MRLHAEEGGDSKPAGKQAGDELHRRGWEEVFQAIGQPSVILDPQHRITAVNAAIVRATGKPEKELLGRKCYELFHGTGQPPKDCPLEKAVASGYLETVEMEIAALGGSFLVSCTPVFDKAGYLVQVIHTATDITERKGIEDALQRRDAILGALNAATERFLRTAAWEEASIQEVLELLGRATEVSRVYIFENHVGKDGTDLTSQRYEWAAPGVAAQMDNPDLQNSPWQAGGMGRWQEKLSRGELIQGHVQEFPASEQAVLVPQDIKSIVAVPIFVGKKWWGFMGFDECRRERTWSAVEIDALKMSGAIVGALMERQRAEESLRSAHRKLQATFDSIQENVNVVDLEFNITDINETMMKVFGLSGRESVIGRKCFDVLKGRKDICPNCAVAETYRTKAPAFRISTEQDAASTGGRSFEIFAYPIMDKYGQLCGAIEFTRDITERKQTEEKILDYQKRLKSLASELSLAEERERRRIATHLHDHVAQALVLSRINLRTLSRSAGLTDNSLLDEIRESIKSMVEHVQSLTFDLSSPTLYKFGLERAIDELLNEQFQKTETVCRFSDDSLPKPLDDDICVLLFQSVRELLINVIKHAQAHEVRVAVERAGDTIRVTVSDDGVGFDTGRLDSFTERLGGFGLFNIRERLDYIGGSFMVWSEPGEGSRFTLTAPLKTETD